MSASGPEPILAVSRAAQRRQCRIVAGARRGGGQSQQGAPLRIVQPAFGRHRLGGIVDQRPLRCRPVIGALQDRRPRPIRGGTVQRGKHRQRAGAIAAPRIGVGDQQGSALRQLRREVGRNGCIERCHCSCHIALAQPKCCQPRAETGPRDVRGRCLHQFLQHRPGALRQIERYQPIGQFRLQGIAVGAGREQVGVLLHHRHQLQRRKRVRRVVAQQPGKHVGEFAMDRDLVVREQRLAVAKQGKRGAPSAGACLELGQTFAQRALLAIAAPGIQQTFQPFGGLLRVDRTRGKPQFHRAGGGAGVQRPVP